MSPRLIRRMCVVTVGLVSIATLACASTPPGEDLLDFDPETPPPAIEAMPAEIDMLARVPLADLGEPVAGAFVDEQTFDPHRDTTSGVLQDPYSLPEQDELGAPAGLSDLEHPPADIDEATWIDWPSNLDEFGTRLLLSVLLRGEDIGELPVALHRMADRADQLPLPPLDPDDVTGPAWIGHSVDAQTRSFYDHAHPGPAADPDPQKPWIPHATTTIAIPLSSADEYRDRYRQLCSDQRFSLCDRILDIRTHRGTLVIQKVSSPVDDDDFEDLAEDWTRPDPVRSGLLERLDRKQFTPALAAFFDGDPPGYYARIEGLRRLAVADYLAAHYDDTRDDAPRLAALTSSLQLRLHGDLMPTRDDVSVRLDPFDEGLSIDTTTSRTAESTTPVSEDPTRLPAPSTTDSAIPYATFRIGPFDLDKNQPDPGTWTAHQIDRPEWLQGLLFAVMTRPEGLASRLLDDLETPSPSDVRNFGDLIGADGPAELGYEALRFFRMRLNDPQVLPDPGRLMLETDGLDLHSAALILTQYDAPDPELVQFQQFADPAPVPDRPRGFVLDLYLNSDDVPGVLVSVADHLADDERDLPWSLETETTTTDGRATLRIAGDLPLDAIEADPDWGPAGAKFAWHQTTGEFRRNLDGAYTRLFANSLPPEALWLQSTQTDSASGVSVRIGSGDRTFEPYVPPSSMPRPSVDQSRRCTARVQGRLASMTEMPSLREHRPTLEPDRPPLTGDPEATPRPVGTADPQSGLQLRAASMDTADRTDLERRLAGIATGLRECADAYPDDTGAFQRAADRWETWATDLDSSLD